MATTPLQELREAFRALHQALETAESALIEFEETLEGGGSGSERLQQSGAGFDLLSVPEVCNALGMGKSWVYRRIKSGEIPSVKLGHNIKIKRADLEEYLEFRRYYPSGQ